MAKQTFTTGQVLTAAQMTSLQQTAMLGGAASAKTASYTLVAADAGTAISMSSASATTITVNTALFAAGDTVQITNLGAGVCTITAGTATVNTSASLALAQYESGTLDFTSTSAAIFIKGGGAAGGGMTLINTGGTSLSSTATTISSIPSTYKSLLVIVKNVSVNSDSGTAFRLNTDTGNNYYKSSSAASEWGAGSAVSTNTVAENNYGQLQLPGYTDAGTQFAVYNGYDSYNGQIQAFPAWYNKSATVSSITFRTDGISTFTNGTIWVYGV